MVNFNGSFVSPLADARVVPQLSDPSSVLISLYNRLNGISIWSALLYLFLAAVAYDQCMLCLFLESARGASRGKHVFAGQSFRCPAQILPCFLAARQELTRSVIFSEIHLPQGIDCRPGDENSVHGTFPPVGEPQIPRVQGQMEQRRVELCVGFPQVSTSGVGKEWNLSRIAQVCRDRFEP